MSSWEPSVEIDEELKNRVKLGEVRVLRGRIDGDEVAVVLVRDRSPPELIEGADLDIEAYRLDHSLILLLIFKLKTYTLGRLETMVIHTAMLTSDREQLKLLELLSRQERIGLLFVLGEERGFILPNRWRDIFSHYLITAKKLEEIGRRGKG